MSFLRSRAKSLFYLFSVIAWILVMGIGAEFILRITKSRADQANIYLPRDRDKEPQLDLDTSWTSHNRTIMGEGVAANLDACDSPLRTTADAGLLSDTAWLARFAKADGQRRTSMALLHQVLAFEVDKNSQVQQVWSTWPDNQLANLHGLHMLTGEQHTDIFAMLDPNSPAAKRRVPLPESSFDYVASSRVAALFPGGGGNAVVLATLPPYKPIAEEEPSPRWDEPWFKYAPNYQDKDFGLYQTNSIGFADAEVIIPKPEDTYRIVCVGASTTNEGVDVRSNYVNVIEEVLNRVGVLPRSAGFTRIDVVNCGVEGITSERILRRMDDYLTLEPDLILLLEGINDLAFQILPTDAIRPAASWRKYLAKVSSLYARLDSHATKPDMTLVQGALRGSTLARFDAFITHAHDCGVQVALCTIPMPDLQWISPAYERFLDIDLATEWTCPNTTFRDYAAAITLLNQELGQLARERKCPLIPIDTHFQGVVGGPHFFYDVCHLYPLGYAAKAHIVGRYLADMLRQD